ncbi:MAG TPA: carboxypeptidase regulatory-like domain-containing protein [Pyrinomonadaceae bacterium]
MKTRILLCLALLVCSGRIAAAGQTYSSPSTAGSPTNSSAPGEAFINLRDFGAVGDGETNDSQALQDALDSLAESGGGTLFIPAGRYALLTPVDGNFTGLGISVTIQDVESTTPVPPVNSPGDILSRGLDLVSEFAPRTNESGAAITISGLESFLIKDITFIGTPDIATDATVTLSLYHVNEATIRHCEFYGLRSVLAGGAVVLSVASDLHLEQSVFLGCSGNSAVQTPVVQIVDWKGVSVSNAIFIDYGQRAELFGKLGGSAPFSWINIGNADAPEGNSPRRQVVVKDVFFDEGGLFGLSSIPTPTVPPATPYDLLHISGLHMNVSNLDASGNYISGVKGVLIEDSHYGWSHRADSAIRLVGVESAILDRVECLASADRIRADAATGSLVIIDSIYNNLDSLAKSTRVIQTNAPDEDPVKYVRQQFQTVLGREADPAALYFWSKRQLDCGEDLTCLAGQRAEFDAFLNTSPPANFSLSGKITRAKGGGLAGVAVKLSGSQSVTTLTDSLGRYLFRDLPTSGVYTLTPQLVDYAFEPKTLTIITPNTNQTLDFDALESHAITVRVTETNGSAIPGAKVTLSGTLTGFGVTNASGQLTFAPLPRDGRYVLTVEKANYIFTPESFEFDELDSNQTVVFIGGPPPKIEFSQKSYSVNENTKSISITVTRNGHPLTLAEVTYSAIDGTADQRSDVTPVVGRLSFEPGETSQSFTVFVTDDAHVEGDESLTLELSDPVGAALGNKSTATLVIIDNDTSETTFNPIDGVDFFVRQQYRDFLNRPPDAEGLAFWSNQILSCGTNAACIDDRRMNVSAAFFLSIEFRETGFFVYRLYEVSFAHTPRHLEEFLLDTRTIGEGVIVNAPGWQALIETNKKAFIESFAEREQFTEAYPASLTPTEFVDLLNEKTGDMLSPGEIAAAIAEFEGAATSESVAARARALRRIAENETFSQLKLNSAFVLMQYFGYLLRNPDDFPNTNLDGYNFWLNKLEEFDGDFRRADMVKSFLVSGEYRARFGAP